MWFRGSQRYVSSAPSLPSLGGFGQVMLPLKTLAAYKREILCFLNMFTSLTCLQIDLLFSCFPWLRAPLAFC